MAEIDDIAAQVIAPLASTVQSATTRVVADAFRLVIAPEEEYVESKVAIESLEFASFAVGGLSAAAVTPTTGVRASSEVTLPLSDSAGGSAEVRQRIVLFGPGDVRGIDPEQILRRHPAPGTSTAEETDLAHIEFDRPELPWAFSAATPDQAMRPWVTLIVVERSLVRWLPATALLPLIEVPRSELPDLDEVNRWAHAQVAQSGSVALATRLSPAYAPVNLSRLVSPRVLADQTDYLAAVVPTTDVGVRGGRGVTGGSLQPAWTSAADSVILPVYDSWEFRTGEDGDFATLALRLQGVAAPYEVGRRFIDVSEPGRPLASLPPAAPGRKQVLRCALISPTPPPPDKVEIENATWSAEQTELLREQLDLPARIEGSEEATDPIPDVPVLGPRIYAKLHRGAAVITGTDWFAELNLSPQHRIVAGLGTRVVQRDQEQLMQAAWAQLGDVERANRAIALAELAELLATRYHARISALEPSRLLQVAGPLASRVSLTAGTTLAGEVAASATPAVVLSGAFRRSIRPDGPVLRRADVAAKDRIGSIAGAGTLTRDFTRTYANPDGVGGVSAESIAQLDVRFVAPVLGVAEGTVASTLAGADAALHGGLFAHLADASSWKAPVAGFDPSVAVAERWGEAVLREPTIPAIKKVREQRIAPLVAELATTRAAEGIGGRGLLEERAASLNNSLIVRLGAGRAADGGAGRAVAGGVGRGAAIVRGNAIGGAVARVGIGVVRAAPVADVGRVATGIRGLNMLDVTALTRVTAASPAETRTAALRELAALSATPVTPVLDAVRGLPVDQLRAAIPALLDPAGVLTIQTVPRRATVDVSTLTAALEPRVTVRAALRGRLRLSDALAETVFRPERVRRIMAAPMFRRPMYQALNDYGTDWLIPGLGLLPDDDFVTVLATNREFMEAFLVGLSDEMGRELLWRNYPTDQSGTYFRRFWDEDQDELPTQIHAFRKTALGTHISLGGDGGSEPRAVIVVKSELVRRYPDVIIQAVKNHGTPAAPQFDGPQAVVARQLFAAHLPPDIALVGVDLGLDEIDQDEWWITIAEHPTATRFDRPRTETRRFLRVPGAVNGADFAKERLHDPVRVAFHATDLVVREG